LNRYQALIQEGLSHHQTGQLEEARACYLAAATQGAPPEEIHYLLAELSFHEGQFDEAEAQSKAALLTKPQHPNAMLCLAQIWLAKQQAEAAETILRELVTLTPDWPLAWERLGMAAQLTGALEQAEEAYCRCIELQPSKPEGWTHLARLYLECSQPAQAIATLEQGLQHNPDDTTLQQVLGDAHRRNGNAAEARALYRRVTQDNRNGALAITEAITLPDFYHSTDHVEGCRRHMEQRLAEIEDTRYPACPDPVAAGGKNNFYSIYQGFDDRPLQEQLARLWRKIYTPTWPEPLPRPPGRQRIKIGFVSAHFRHHTIGDLFSGLIAGLPPADFERIVFHLGEQFDDSTAWLARHVERLHHPRTNDLAALADLIGGEACDILVYPDIGMEPLTYFLAFNRLALVQAVSWGHPLTTGLDTIDYFISSAQQEPPEGDRYYTERLLRLSTIPAQLPTQLPPSATAPDWRARYHLPPDARLIAVVQSLFKLHPAFDEVLASLAADDRNRLLFVNDAAGRIGPQLMERLKAALPAECPPPILAPHLNYQDYLSLLAQADLSLDTRPFGGGKTVFDAALVGTPVAFLHGTRLANRTAQAMDQLFSLKWPQGQSTEALTSAIRINKGGKTLSKPQIEEANQAALEAWTQALGHLAKPHA